MKQDALRQRIDELDEGILELRAERRRLSQELLDDAAGVREHAARARANGGAATVRAVFQGVGGAYSHLAARSFFGDGPEASCEGLPELADVVRAVEGRKATHGVLPVENTTAGSVHPVYDLLLGTGLSVVGEIVLRVEHCLVGVEEVPLGSLRRVFSHWQALAQCSRFLAELPEARAVPWGDTALAASKIAEDGDPAQAAIASEEAARRHGLPVLRRDVSDERENLTRFLVLARDPVRVDPRLPAKTSLVMSVPHRPGALLKALAALEAHGLNLTKIESRPQKGSPFEYLFYLDFEGNLEEPRVRYALAALRCAAGIVRVLGCYPAARRPEGGPDPRCAARDGAG
ncbi:MAG: bifunctional chorismate mutase/prephenate dehydratase [Thermoanaerobaculia bacterium]